MVLGIYMVSSLSGFGVDELRTALVQSVSKERYMNEEIPQNYIALEEKVNALKTTRAPPVMTWTEFQRFVSPSLCCVTYLGIHSFFFFRLALGADIPEQDVLSATQYLHDLGVLLYFNDAKCGLSDIVILEPQWLADVRALVLLCKLTNFL
jgi:hypothetical protein